MRAKNSKIRTKAPGTGQRLRFDVSEEALAASPFQTALSGLRQACERGSTSKSRSAPRPIHPTGWHEICSNALARAWSFLHAKYKISTAKRLRVSETVSLGEKRFVAIVAVEGREFLIGGGVSGISLLALLGPATGAASDLGSTFGDVGGAL